MKKLKLAVIFFVFTAALISCKKDTITLTPEQVTGTYAGFRGFESENPGIDCSFSILAGAVFHELSPGTEIITGEGTWQLNGNTLTAYYHQSEIPGHSYSISGTINGSSFTGTWGFGNSKNNGGRLEMGRQ